MTQSMQEGLAPGGPSIADIPNAFSFQCLFSFLSLNNGSSITHELARYPKTLREI